MESSIRRWRSTAARVRAVRAPLRKKVLGPIPPPENSLGIHSDPCAYTGICFGLSGPKVTVQIVRSSSGLRCATAAVPFADNRQSKAVRRRVDGREGDGISTYRGTFDDIVQSFVEPRTEPQRTGIGHLTNCGRSQRHYWHPSRNSRCQCMRLDSCGFQDDPHGRSKKFFG